MTKSEILKKLHEIAANPSKQKEKYLACGEKIVLTAPVYTPEEIIHSMGIVPMGAWGADMELNESKKYFPAFICSIMQSIVELGMKGIYDGVSAILIPSLCDSLKVLGENWKYAVPSIPFIPMTYPQNRKPEFGVAYTKAGYERVIRDLEKATGCQFNEADLQKSIQIYNEHNEVMREVSKVLSKHADVTASQRNDIFKSAYFMRKEEHTQLIKDLIDCLTKEPEDDKKIKIMTSGILADSPYLLEILEENGLQIVADDVAAESRQYRVDADVREDALECLAEKFSNMDNCSLLYDVEKKRVKKIIEDCKSTGAKGVIVILTKFCDPEEFDYPFIKKACQEQKIPVLLIEVDRQMENNEQARTMIETFKDML